MDCVDSSTTIRFDLHTCFILMQTSAQQIQPLAPSTFYASSTPGPDRRHHCVCIANSSSAQDDVALLATIPAVSQI